MARNPASRTIFGGDEFAADAGHNRNDPRGNNFDPLEQASPMETIWNSIYGSGLIYVGFFSWAVFLSLSAKFVFGADLHHTVSSFFVGLGINATVLIFGAFRLPTLTAFYTDREWELHGMTTGLISIPVVITIFGALYPAFRRLGAAGDESVQEIEDHADPKNDSANGDV